MKNFLLPISLFLKFIKKPSNINRTIPSIRYLDGILLLFIPVVLLENVLMYTMGNENKIKLSFQPDDYFFYFHIILLAPILEEVIFRVCLKGARKKLIISALGAFAYVAIRTKGFVGNFLQVDYALLCVGFFLIALYFFKPLSRKAELRSLFYGMTLLFAVLHVFNYNISVYVLPLLLISVLSYLILGFAFAFYRLEYGFLKALKIHVFYNFLTVSGLLIIHVLGILFDK